ncbi:NAD(+) synthase [Thermophilibacter immobilis]|jgi:NAD+ synthase (glutamine-hydrolysing)|uniref:Glutamine-dependent NAD(+) synthetase n=1 Tax=Thermophilibacter immobilis TaxID=2779519 RepID=A0A7S7M8Z9_9ACTN|nr:NAD(+) synthase [Thermophilibacter immobilis]QOY60914.1 NAD(+) synthase [Thermophilibacter immobilis]
MQDGFVKVCAVTPEVRVADVRFNVDACVEAVNEACTGEGAMVVVLPELALTAYTCEDLFWQDALLDAVERGLADFAARTSDLDALLLVGLPVRVNAKLYNCCAVLSAGTILGVVPKRHLPTYNEFYEGRHFVAGTTDVVGIDLAGQLDVPFGMRQLFACEELSELVVAVEICEDLWVPEPPSIAHAQAGATLVCNLSASNELVGKADYRRSLVCGQSARLVCGYAYASSGAGESTQDLVFSGHDLVAENGRLLAEGASFQEGRAVSELDVRQLVAERRRMSTFETAASAVQRGYHVSRFSLDVRETRLTRWVDPHPFVPADAARRAERCEDVLAIQAHGLAKRLAHTHARRAVVGVSGGLDSTLALLVAARAFDLLDLDRSGIIAVTMPGFGTTDRTHDNACSLSDALDVDLREVNIADAVRQHFSDIGHDEAVHDVTYENAQARERTQVLMDLANQEGGFVIGTGDLSELALGWATYNGDHMSMYAVNASVPKTLVRHLVRYVADTCGEEETSEVLYDVLDTPVSPELLPASGDGTISQRTEDLVGPYELHDFFLYEVLRHGASPRKVYRLACHALGQIYDDETILSWLKVFYRRFFSQQFKRSCLPDGPKVGSVAVSPRGDLRMPSDACATLWLAELEEL